MTRPETGTDLNERPYTELTGSKVPRLKPPENWNSLTFPEKVYSTILTIRATARNPFSQDAPPQAKAMAPWIAFLDSVQVVGVETAVAKKGITQALDFRPVGGKVAVVIISEGTVRRAMGDSQDPEKEMNIIMSAICHEDLHLALGHVTRKNILLKIYGDRIKKIVRLAEDVVVNAILLVNGFMLAHTWVGTGIGKLEVVDENSKPPLVTYRYQNAVVEDVLSKSVEEIAKELMNAGVNPPEIPEPQVIILQQCGDEDSDAPNQSGASTPDDTERSGDGEGDGESENSSSGSGGDSAGDEGSGVSDDESGDNDRDSEDKEDGDSKGGEGSGGGEDSRNNKNREQKGEQSNGDRENSRNRDRKDRSGKKERKRRTGQGRSTRKDQPSSQAEDISRKLLRQALESARRAGTVPLGMERYFEWAMTPPPPDLKRELKRFLTQTTTGKRDTDWRRAYRFAPPNLVLPDYSRRKGLDLMVVVDTSGSISEKELEEFFGVLEGVLREMPAKMDISYHDTELYKGAKDVKTPRDLIKAARNARGGGGTDFRPAFRMAEKEKKKAFILFTDGVGPWPDSVSENLRRRTLVVLTPDGTPPEIPVRWVRLN